MAEDAPKEEGTQEPPAIGATPDAVTVVVARDILGDLVARAGYANERIVITKHGKDTAALIGIRDLERLRALDGAA